MNRYPDKFFRLSDENGWLGLSCGSSGLSLAGVPLLEAEAGVFAARPWPQVRKLLGEAYRAELPDVSIKAGLDVVADALNTEQFGKAMAAAVLLKLPQLDWDGAVRLANVETSFAKYRPDQARDWHGRWALENDDVGPDAAFLPADMVSNTGGESVGASDPNGLQQIPTDYSFSLPADWVHIPYRPRRNDELADLAEWVVNAKAEDEAVIRQEINRYFFETQPQNAPAGNAFHRALSDALEPGLTQADRQEILAEIEPITRTDPPPAWAVAAAGIAGVGLALGPPGEASALALDSFIEAEFLAGTAEAGGVETAAGSGVAGALDFGAGSLGIGDGTAAALAGSTELGLGETAATTVVIDGVEVPASSVWRLGWAARGNAVEDALGNNLSRTFPVIDKAEQGFITSIKSVDLDAAVYQDGGRLLWRIDSYVDRLAKFDGARWGGYQVLGGDAIVGRTLHLGLPRAVSISQRAILQIARDRAKAVGINISFTLF